MPDAPAPVAAKPAPQPAAAATPTAVIAPAGQPPPQLTPAQEAAKKANAPPAPTDKAKEQADRDAAALARARRVEASNRESEKRIKDEQAKFSEERRHHAEELAQAAEYKRLQEARAKGPRATLKALGYTEQEILEEIAKGDAAKTPEEVVKETVAKELADRDARAKVEHEKAAKEREAQIQAQAGAQYRAAQDKLATMIKAEPDKYEFCNAQPDAARQAWALVEEYWTLTEKEGKPELLPFEEALETLEEDLLAKHLTLGSTSKKLKAKAEAEASEKKKQDEEKAAAAAAAKKGVRESRPMTGFKTLPTPTEPAAAAATSEVAATPKEPTTAERAYRVSSRKARIAGLREKYNRPNDA